MAKKSQITEAVESTFKDLESFGYSVAGSSDILKKNGAYALDHIKNFLTEPAKDDLDQLKAGFRKRYETNNPAIEYAVIDGNYIPVDQLPHDAKPLEVVKIGVSYAFSFTQQAIGAMKRDNLGLYNVVFNLRDLVNKYCKNCMDDLIAAAKREYARRNPKTQTRAATLAMIEFLEKEFETFKTRCKTAEARGNDPTADSNKLARASAAFWKEYDVK